MSNRSRSAQTKPTSAAALPDRKARFSPSINYSSVGPSVRELLQQRYSRSGSKSRSRAEKHKPRPRPKSKRRPSVDDEEAQTEQIDSELVRNKTLTIFSTATFTGVLQQIAQKHATKLIKEIEDKFHDESLSSSSSSSDDGSNDDSDSESSEISTYELPQEPEFPIVRFLALLAAFPLPDPHSDYRNEWPTQFQTDRGRNSHSFKHSFEKAVAEQIYDVMPAPKKRKIRQ